MGDLCMSNVYHFEVFSLGHLQLVLAVCFLRGLLLGMPLEAMMDGLRMSDVFLNNFPQENATQAQDVRHTAVAHSL